MKNQIVGAIETLIAEVLGPAVEIHYEKDRAYVAAAAIVSNPRLAAMVSKFNIKYSPPMAIFGTTLVTILVNAAPGTPGIVGKTLAKCVAKIDYGDDLLIISRPYSTSSLPMRLAYSHPDFIDQLTVQLQAIYRGRPQEWRLP